METEPDEISRIRAILKDNPKGLTTEEVAKKLPLNRTSTAKYLNTLLISGQAEMRTFGRAKVFTLSQRIPFSQMLNLSSDLLIVLDHDVMIKQVNEPLVKTFSLQRDSLIEKRFENSDIYPYFESNIEMIRESLKGTEITRLERIEIKGNEFFFRMKLIPVVFDQGEQGLAIILQDITELKQYQQHLERLVEERTGELRKTNDRLLEEMRERQKSRAALEESERKYRQLVENANSIIIRVNDKGTILFFNEFAEKFFRISESDMLGKNIVGIIFPATYFGKTPEEEVKNFLVSSESLAYNEIPCNGKNGDQTWVAWTIRPILDSVNTPVEYLLVGIDITERKNVENALHRVNAKLNLVSSVARHDILNKLTIVMGLITLLKELITDATQRDYLQRAEDAMDAIKNQILFTRDFKDMGKERAYWQALDDSLEMVRKEMSYGKIILEVPEIHVEIFADAWLNKVFSNLVHFIRHTGKTTTKISIRFQESARGLDIIIEDNGIGIPVQNKERIFERSISENNGYDMFLAREILAITDMLIKETGEPGKGVRFVIQVPKRGYRIQKND